MKNKLEEKLEELTNAYETEVGNINKEWDKLPDYDKAHNLSTIFTVASFGWVLAGLVTFLATANVPVALTFCGLGLASSVPSAVLSVIATKSSKKAKALRRKEKAMWVEYCDKYDEIQKEKFVLAKQERTHNNTNPKTENTDTLFEQNENNLTF